MADDTTRVSVAVTRSEMDEIQRLSRRCNTSISALGQVAIRQLLVQARSGAIPMIPPLEPVELTSRELMEQGRLVSIDALDAEWVESLDRQQTKINLDTAQGELLRVDTLVARAYPSKA